MAPQAGIPEGLGAAIVNGLGLMPEGEALSRALEAKTWLDSALTTVSAGTTALSALSNPLHALFSGAANWALNNFKPLNVWMNNLTGDPEHVRQVAAGWREIGERLQADAASLNQSVTTDMAETEGLAVSAYADMQRDTAAHIAVLGGYAKALAFLLEEASTVVQKVRELVCKAISDVAAQAGQSAILTGCTLGLGTPIAIKQAADKVAEWAKKLSNIVNAVPRMAQAIQNTSQKGAVWLNKLDSGLKKRTAGKGSAHVVSKTSTKKTTKARSKEATKTNVKKGPNKTKKPPKTNNKQDKKSNKDEKKKFNLNLWLKSNVRIKIIKGLPRNVLSRRYHKLPKGFRPIVVREDHSRTENRGGKPGSRKGLKVTPAGKDETHQRNAASHKDGLAHCSKCGIIVSAPFQHVTGYNPPPHEAHADHIVPRSKNGSGDPSNTQTLCRSCNLTKKNK